MTDNCFSHTIDQTDDTNNKEISMLSIQQNGETKTEDSEEEIERKHFRRIVNAFRCYKAYSLKRLDRTTSYLCTLPKHQRELLKSYSSHLEEVRVAIHHNHEVIRVIIKDVAKLFQNADHSNDVENLPHTESGEASPLDMDKVQSVLKQLFREWSSEGKEERDASFKPILDEIELRFPANSPDIKDLSRIKVLVPGAGLGRLPYEIAHRGYTCQGNEYSLFMLFTSNFVLNKVPQADMLNIYPWAHQYHNCSYSADQLQIVRFPDICPNALPPNVNFSMAAGSFIDIYKWQNDWNCVATCFFLDTANNVMDYIETTWRILKPGGYWINLGPLLYHHADLPSENSIEPSYEEIRNILIKYGFTLLKEEVNIPTPYCQNSRSMMRYEYRSVFFVCQKPFDKVS